MVKCDILSGGTLKIIFGVIVVNIQMFLILHFLNNFATFYQTPREWIYVELNFEKYFNLLLWCIILSNEDDTKDIVIMLFL